MVAFIVRVCLHGRIDIATFSIFAILVEIKVEVDLCVSPLCGIPQKLVTVVGTSLLSARPSYVLMLLILGLQGRMVR